MNSSVERWLKWLGTSLVVQWPRLYAPNAGGPGSISGWRLRSHMLHNSAKKNFKKVFFFNDLFLALLGLSCCEGFSRVAVHGLLTEVASLVVEHGP